MKKSFFFFLLPFLLVLASSVTMAVGVSPPRYDLNFEPEITKTYGFRVRNNADRDMLITTSLGGELSEYAELSSNSFLVKANGYETFYVQLKLPRQIETPGRHIIRVSILEEPAGGAGVGARTGVVPVILVHVPYPGRYVDLSKIVVASGQRGVNAGEDVSVAFTLNNRGKERISNSHAVVDLYHDDGTVVGEQRVDNIALDVNGTYEGSARISTVDVSPSSYNARVRYYYDSEVRERQANVIIGGFDLLLKEYERNITYAGIVPVLLSVSNLWKGSVDVEAQLVFENFTTDRSPRKRMNDFATETFITYVDTRVLGIGNHSAQAVMFFGQVGGGEGGFETKSFPVTIEIVEPVAPVEEQASFFSMTMIIVIAVVLVLVINGVVLYYFLSNQKKKNYQVVQEQERWDEPDDPYK